jgi:UDP-glucose 4-epimerase
MNILMTGSTGFIGSNLVEKLQNLNHKLYLLNRSSSNLSRLPNLNKNVLLMPFDSHDDLAKIFEENNFDVIIHLATHYLKNEKDWKDIKTMNDVNINFPSLLLGLAVKRGLKAFLNTGTCFEYDPSVNTLTENDLLKPYNYYASTKIAFEEILKYHANNGLRASTLKLFFPYGEKDNEKLIPLLIKSIIVNKSINLTKGEQRLGFTYIGDIVNAYLKALTFIISDDYKKYEVFNIGSADAYSPREIVKMLKRINNNITNVSFDAPYPKNEIMHMVCNPEKAKNILGWQPQTDLFEGLKKVYSFYSK